MYLTSELGQQLGNIKKIAQARNVRINLLFDFNNLFYRCCLSSNAIEVLTNTAFQDFAYVKNTLITSILDLKRILSGSGVQVDVIILMDQKDPEHNYWRNYIMKEYKGTRSKWSCPIPKDIFNKQMQVMKDDVKKHFPWKIVKVTGAEADDSVGVLTRRLNDAVNVVISTDSDLQQVLVNDMNYIYEPRKNIIIDHTADTKYDLFVKFIKGDAGDGIPNIFSDEDTLITQGKRQKAVKKTLVNEMYEEYQNNGFKSVKDKYEWTDVITTRFVHNRKMIDLKMIPEDIVNSINKEYDEFVPNGDGTTFMNYCINQGLTPLIQRATEVR